MTIYGYYALIAHFRVQIGKIAGVSLLQHLCALLASDLLVIATGAERVLHILKIAIIAHCDRLSPYRITSDDSDFVVEQLVLKCSEFPV